MTHHYEGDGCEAEALADEADMKEFNSGSTRSSEPLEDYEGFLSPLVIETYGRYMSRHRTQANGEMRNSDNWQKGMPKARYMRSMWRHFLEVWKIWRTKGLTPSTAEPLIDALCALMFNVQGMLLEVLISAGMKRPIVWSEEEEVCHLSKQQ